MFVGYGLYEAMGAWDGWSIPLALTVFLCVAVPLGVLGATALYAPLSYEVSHDTLRIRRIAPDVRVPVRDVASVEGPDADLMLGSLRLFGSGGLYGFFGLFRNKRLGTYHAYATRRDTLVRCVCSDGTQYILSPDDPAAFLRAVRAAAQLK